MHEKQFFRLIPKKLWHLIIANLGADVQAILSLAEYVSLNKEIVQKISHRLLLECTQDCPDIQELLPSFHNITGKATQFNKQLVFDVLSSILSTELNQFIASGPKIQKYLPRRSLMLHGRVKECIKDNDTIDAGFAMHQLSAFDKKEILELMLYYNFLNCLANHCCAQVERIDAQLKKYSNVFLG